jgi:hypothetical protein
MLLDTGGGISVISPDVAARGNCVPYGRDVGHRMSGETVVFRQCEAWEFHSGDWGVTLDPVGVFDVNALLPGDLERLDGILALDAFRGRVMTLDWGGGEIRVHGDAESPHRQSVTLPIRVASGDNGRFLSALVEVKASRGALWFLLDSGNILGTVVSRHAVDERLIVTGADSTATLAISGIEPVTLTIQVKDLEIDGALGTDFLMKGPVTLDLRAGLQAIEIR